MPDAPFVKLQGTGNDFILLDLPGELLDLPWEQLAPRLCDRHYGVGADGLLLRLPSDVAAHRMRVLNADGSEAETCGNGLRCFVRYLHAYGHLTDSPCTIETRAGVTTPVLLTDAAGNLTGVQVSMGVPELARERIPMAGAGRSPVLDEPVEVAGTRLLVTALSMGNPHAVVFVPDVAVVALEVLGQGLASHPTFPRGANAEFVQVLGSDRLRMRVWERGAGPTLACGSGACAVVVAGALTGRSGRQVTVELPGGELEITWQADGQVVMTGPAEVVYAGVLDL